jgi:hypothetical protein
MNLPQSYEVTGIDTDRPPEPFTVAVDTPALIAAPKTQVQRGIGRLAYSPKASAKRMQDASMLPHGRTCEE